MKKILWLLLLLVLVPIKVQAKGYQSLNLEDALLEEGIKPNFTELEESDDKATIYLFRGKGCQVCRAFLTFLNSIAKDYGKYFQVVSYEVWNNPDNALLYKQVAEYVGEKPDGVPLIIIGEKVYSGYASELDKEIKEEIKKLANSKEKYDVFEAMYNNEEFASHTEAKVSLTYILWSTALSIASTIIIIAFVSNKINKLKKEG